MTRRFNFVSAVHLFLMKDNKVLLLRRHNTGYEDGKLSVVAGHLNGGEEIVEAAIREAKEEVGVEISPEWVEVRGVMHRVSDDERIDWFVSAKQWRGKVVNRESEKCSEILWVDLDRLPEDIIPYVRRALGNMLVGRWFDSYGWENQ